MHRHSHRHHHHHRHHEIPGEKRKGRAFLIGILLNTVFVAAEFTAGFLFNSTGLLADAGHNLSDVSGLLISLFAFQLAKKRNSENYTYGFRKGTVWASLLNAFLLLGAVGVILCECVQKIIHPEPVGGWAVIVTASIGIVINGLTALLFMKEQAHDLNVKGAYLHMLADTLVSAGVAVSGLLILLAGWNMLDPVIGIVIALVILVSTWSLLKESLRLAMDGVPEGISVEAVRKHLLELPNVKGVHHLHIWAVSTTENALTAHVVLEDLREMDRSRNLLRRELTALGIRHATLEFETAGTVCGG